MFDVIVIGGGPSGLTAALYARRANKTVLVIEKDIFGGQITFSPKVENIPGFAAVTGNEFAEKLVDQVLGQGAEVEYDKVTAVEKTENGFTVKTEGSSFEGKTVILATGAKHRMLGVAGEEQLVGHGISFCAVCDGAFYAGRTVGVVGGGNSALQEALMLSDLVKKVIVIQNLDFLTGEKKLQEALAAKDNVEILLGTVVDGFEKENGELSAVRLADKNGKTVLPLDGLFIAIGLVPQNEPFSSLVRLDERGYVVADEDVKTDTPGLFVAGDCRQKRIRQVATAAADGAIAALSACDFVDSLT